MTRFLNKQLGIILIFVFLLTLPVFKNILRPGYFPMHDDFQAIRLLEIDKCVKDAQIPCRWVPDMGFGYGYPQFNYYAPTPYYVMEIFHLLGFGYLDSVKAFIVFISLISTFGMFVVARSLWGNIGGLISSVLYVYLPYRAVDMYVRGALSELSAMGVLPFIFWSARKVVLGKRKGILWLAVSTALLFTSHNIISLLTLPFLLLWFVFLSAVEYSNINTLLKRTGNFFLGIVWGVGMSAFFVVPAWFEKTYVHIETITSGYFNYLAHFLDIKQILFSNSWGYGTSQLGPGDDIALTIGTPHWMLPLIVILIMLIFKKKKQFLYVSFLAASGWIALFLTHPRSTIIWDSISLLKYIQFPWRFLLFSGFVFSLASGSFATIFPTSKTRQAYVGGVFTLFLFVLVFVFYGSYFRPKEWLLIKDSDKFSGELWTKQITASIYDYLPIFAKKAPDQEAAEKPVIINGDGEVLPGVKGTNWQIWDVRVSSNQMILQLQLFYFPGWKVLIDDIATDIDYENDLGLITLRLPKGEQKVEARLEDTLIRKAANTISMLAFLPILGLIIKRKSFGKYL